MSYGQLPPGPVNPDLIDAMVAGRQRSLGRAYIFWYFGGMAGIHNFSASRCWARCRPPACR